MTKLTEVTISNLNQVENRKVRLIPTETAAINPSKLTGATLWDGEELRACFSPQVVKVECISSDDQFLIRNIYSTDGWIVYVDDLIPVTDMVNNEYFIASSTPDGLVFENLTADCQRLIVRPTTAVDWRNFEYEVTPDQYFDFVEEGFEIHLAASRYNKFNVNVSVHGENGERWAEYDGTSHPLYVTVEVNSDEGYPLPYSGISFNLEGIDFDFNRFNNEPVTMQLPVRENNGYYPLVVEPEFYINTIGRRYFNTSFIDQYTSAATAYNRALTVYIDYYTSSGEKNGGRTKLSQGSSVNYDYVYDQPSSGPYLTAGNHYGIRLDSSFAGSEVYYGSPDIVLNTYIGVLDENGEILFKSPSAFYIQKYQLNTITLKRPGNPQAFFTLRNIQYSGTNPGLNYIYDSSGQVQYSSTEQIIGNVRTGFDYKQYAFGRMPPEVTDVIISMYSWTHASRSAWPVIDQPVTRNADGFFVFDTIIPEQPYNPYLSADRWAYYNNYLTATVVVDGVKTKNVLYIQIKLEVTV